MSDDVIVDDVPAPSAAEVEARNFGWVPLEEFKGDPDKWRDAEAFLEKGKQINGFLRKDLEKLKSQLSARDMELQEMKAAMKEFADFHRETEARAYERARAELKEAKKQAVRDGDGDRVVEIEEQMEKLSAIDPSKKPAPVEPARPALPQEFSTWNAQNPWYGTDEDMSAYADGVATRLRKAQPELVGTAFLELVEQRTRAAFPAKFQRRPTAVDTGSDDVAPVTRKSSTKSYAALPQEAKAACDRFVKQGLMTQAEYVKQYFEGL